jgi:uncharacterized alkaline shock family protein YloU
MKDQIFNRDRATDLGIIRINNDAIATIASIAAMEVKGVHRMGGVAGKTVYEALFNRARPRGVRIQMKNSDVRLMVSIIVEYGIDIPRVADEVQDNVKRAVERMTGLILSEVDVVVESVHTVTASDIETKRDRRQL